MLATGGIDKMARLWSPATGLPADDTEPILCGDDVVDVDFDAGSGGMRMLAASRDGTVTIREPGGELRSLPGLSGVPVWCADFSDDGKWIIAGTGGNENQARIWHGDSLEPLQPALQHRSPVAFVALTASDAGRLPVAWTATSPAESSNEAETAAPVEAAKWRLESGERMELSSGADPPDVVAIHPKRGRWAVVVETRTGYALNHRGLREGLAQEDWIAKLRRLYAAEPEGPGDAPEWKDTEPDVTADGAGTEPGHPNPN